MTDFSQEKTEGKNKIDFHTFKIIPHAHFELKSLPELVGFKSLPTDTHQEKLN